MKKIVLIPLANGFEEIEAVTIIDVLRRGGIEVIIGYLGASNLVLGANGITIQGDIQIKDVVINMLDMIVLPGGWSGTKTLATDETTQNILKLMDKKNKLIGAICAAPFALHSAGVLKHNYTCYPSVENEIRVEEQMSKVVILVDGKNVAYRMHYSHLALQTKEGFPTGMLHGFLYNLLRLHRAEPEARFIFCWDGAPPTWRHILQKQYKANRKVNPEQPRMLKQ